MGNLAAIAVPKYHDLHEEARLKAAGAVAEAQARINLAFAQYLSPGHAYGDLRPVELVADYGAIDRSGVIFIDDPDTDLQPNQSGKVGGRTFMSDVKTLVNLNKDTHIETMKDPEGNEIDIKDKNYYLLFPQCESAAPGNS